MITLRVDRESDGRITGFLMQGHAGSGPHGFDLVCAGASAVSFGALNAVEELADVELSVRQSPDGGFLLCSLPAGSDQGDRAKAQLIMEAMLVSMRTIEESYGKYIHIIDKGGTDHVET
ncbi:ribosomal-processing cysteine protease Prp [Sporolactobacillus shoreae]|uniref:Ribosomal processing cysteine protease Prp n=1 Tax=Sporolactobacillus shoreae TaxID=1465501 RepID=A0A4Z0GQH1_9BACL|nr:ribosomal-processing cysteine protease Prp [Sporolactobacillus shoreae]TGA99493.1 ribosomal-processing cysteine protease Prp [Sporolactobacillus shoreae]